MDHEIVRAYEDSLRLPEDYAAVASVQEREEQALFRCENVRGLAVGSRVREGRDTGETCITVLVSQKIGLDLLPPADRIPAEIDGVPTDVIESGEIFAGRGPEEPRPEPELAAEGGANGAERVAAELAPERLARRLRPVEGGYSVGHYEVTAGTIATAVVDRSAMPGVPPRYYLLSNNHVLANSNDGQIGDPVLQPGPFDGGQLPGDAVGRLARYVPLRFGAGETNLVDAAVAQVPFGALDREIFWIGTPRGVARVRVGTMVQKTGRTTHWSTGLVRAVNASVDVNYGRGRVARFRRQIVTTEMSAGGDSGSLLLDMQERAVGLLFAGSSTATIHNPIGSVGLLLGIRIP